MGNKNSKRKADQGVKSLIKKKMVVVGLEGAGKTTLIHRLKYGNASNVKPTVGFNLDNLRTDELELMIFDVAGGARSMWSHYLENADIVMFVFDASNHNQFSLIKELITKINSQEFDKPRLFIAALNKCDLAEAMSNEEFVRETKISDLLDSDMFLVRTSATEGTGLAELVNKITGYYGGNTIR
jgi:ADP-ribosylation factor protein 1